MKAKIFLLKTRSGLHCGIGQGLSDIDLPTAREAVSGYPFVPGSSIKGVLRDHFQQTATDQKKFEAAFGSEAGPGDLGASALSFGDARLLCLPVRSCFGTFAYMTSPYALTVFGEAAMRARLAVPPALPTFPEQTDTYHAAVPDGSALLSGNQNPRVLLEDIDLLRHAAAAETANQWAERLAAYLFPESTAMNTQGRDLFKQRFVIVHDDVMAFLCTTALPVAARIRIGERGVVERGALWYEEFVPPESIFAGSLLAEATRGEKKYSARDMFDLVSGSPLDFQVGVDATVGRGLVSMHCVAQED
ncbi:MAG TPA: type III-B CRISPR module RAMP protein Cmr4 [Desulfobacteraceae bacterium]|nr:type III-B CRISPR module RAMP protein Cmr4 [Desulfobacteraceae bacterium]